MLSLDNICLSPQCGFASTVEGNELTDAERWAKMELILRVSRDVRGD